MSIIRSPRPESNFYILDKRISEDGRLSWSARGMLIFLLGKPDHWTVNVEALVNATGVSCRPAGKTAVYAIISELLDAGYMTRQRHASGQLDYYVHEVPEPPVDKGGDPDSGNPNQGNPDLGNPPLVSTDSKQGLTKAVRTDCAPRQKKKAERGTKIPDDFTVGDYMREWAKEHDMRSPDLLVDAFRDHHIARGTLMIDWWAAFRTWIRNDKRFSSPRSDTMLVSSKGRKSLDSMDYSTDMFS